MNVSSFEKSHNNYYNDYYVQLNTPKLNRLMIYAKRLGHLIVTLFMKREWEWMSNEQLHRRFIKKLDELSPQNREELERIENLFLKCHKMRPAHVQAYEEWHDKATNSLLSQHPNSGERRNQEEENSLTHNALNNTDTSLLVPVHDPEQEPDPITHNALNNPQVSLLEREETLIQSSDESENQEQESDPLIQSALNDTDTSLLEERDQERLKWAQITRVLGHEPTPHQRKVLNTMFYKEKYGCPTNNIPLEEDYVSWSEVLKWKNKTNHSLVKQIEQIIGTGLS